MMIHKKENKKLCQKRLLLLVNAHFRFRRDNTNKKLKHNEKELS